MKEEGPIEQVVTWPFSQCSLFTNIVRVKTADVWLTFCKLTVQKTWCLGAPNQCIFLWRAETTVLDERVLSVESLIFADVFSLISLISSCLLWIVHFRIIAMEQLEFGSGDGGACRHAFLWLSVRPPSSESFQAVGLSFHCSRGFWSVFWGAFVHISTVVGRTWICDIRLNKFWCHDISMIFDTFPWFFL